MTRPAILVLVAAALAVAGAALPSLTLFAAGCVLGFVTLALSQSRIGPNGPLVITVRNANDFAVTVRLAGRTATAVAAQRRRRRIVRLAAKTVTVRAGRSWAWPAPTAISLSGRPPRTSSSRRPVMA